MDDLAAPTAIDAVVDNLRRVRTRIADAATAAGRRAEDITLVAVSKTKPAEAVRAALGAGQRVFGENRVQEAAGKFPSLRGAYPGLKLHIIGGLQTNKAREAVRLADVIETLDRPRLAEAIAAAIEKEGRIPTLLVEVNVGDEAQKSGVPRADADGFIDECKGRFGAALAGLMCVPPQDQDPRPHFTWLADRAARHGLPVVSMACLRILKSRSPVARPGCGSAARSSAAARRWGIEMQRVASPCMQWQLAAVLSGSAPWR
jgi:pyridoxal phosphate enzyme (YggS family)